MMRHTTVLLPFITLLVTGAAAAQRSGSSISDERIFAAIGVREGASVCEIGAGDGELTIAAARLVGTSGHVYSSELGDERVEQLRKKVAASRLGQITVVAGDPARTNFPDGTCDALFLRNVYHHFGDPPAMNASIAAALKPGARAAVVDFTPPGKEAERPTDRGKDGLHGVQPETVAKELKEAGLEPVETESGSQRWFIVVAAKPRN
jgi:tRNA A58 N-methylase Trm61